MDPASLPVAIASVASTLNEISGRYESVSTTLATIQSQIKVLETGAQRIQEWLHFTDPTSKAQIMTGLRDAIATVNASLGRLQEDIAGVTHSKPETIEPTSKTSGGQQKRPEFVYDEGRMLTHLTDVEECASLLNFTLNVCQLPTGTIAQEEVTELGLGAKALHRAQTCSRRERRKHIERAELEAGSRRSTDFNLFLRQVVEAEQRLAPEMLSLSDSLQSEDTLRTLKHPSTRGVTGAALPNPAQSQQQDKHELYLPANETERRPVIPDKEPIGVALTTRQPSLDTAVEQIPQQPLASPSSKSPDRRIITSPATTTHVPVAAPPIPRRSAERDVKAVTPNADGAQRPIRRKPVSRPSVTGSVYEQKAEASSSSPADSALSIAEKMTPLTRSLSSLSSNDFLNVELEQSPVEPYADEPPAYAPAPQITLSNPPNLPRRVTRRSSFIDDNCPLVISMARENRVSELRDLLQQGVNMNEADPHTGRTAIMEAARLRRYDACRLLMQQGARTHLKDAQGDTALHHAAREGDHDICQMLLNAGAHHSDCNSAGAAALQVAAEGGHSEAVLCLVNAIPSRKVNEPAMVNAFLTAVQAGDVQTAQALLANGVKPKKIKESWKPAAYAAQSGNLPMLDLILTTKCSLKERSPAGWTPLHFAARAGHQHMVEKLLSLKVPWKTRTKKGEETALHVAASAGHTATALTLLAHKDADVTLTDADDQEVIHHAVRKGDVKLTAELIEKGAKLKYSNKYGWKPIHLASAYGHVPLLAECMTRGVSIEEKLATPSFKPEKRTNAAARRGYRAESRWPHSGARPLHLALEFGHDEVATMLLSGGAKIDEMDSRGWRPLHYAAFHCRPEMVEMLLQRGATADAKTIDGHTALTIGFREYGLVVDQDQRFRIRETLQMAMAGGSRRSIMNDLRQWKSFINIPSSESKTATQRNLSWHTAQLAETLYHPDKTGLEEDDEFSVDDADAATSLSGDADEQDGYGPLALVSTESSNRNGFSSSSATKG